MRSFPPTMGLVFYSEPMARIRKKTGKKRSGRKGLEYQGDKSLTREEDNKRRVTSQM